MKTGTPQNPEIIEPGQTTTAVASGGRIRRALGIILMMIKFTAPAFLIDSVCIWLIDLGHSSVLAWLALLVLFLPALILSGLALLVNLFLFFALVATLSGRTVSAVQAPFARFVRYPQGGGGGGGADGGFRPGISRIRDVTPPSDR